MAPSKPILWHIEISHYNEKARWALEYKGVEHARRALPGGVHMPVAIWLSRGRGATFPLLEIDGRRIGDSTAIIAALEERFPDPPLYPTDPTERRRALELEDWFDEEVGPHTRLLAFHEATRNATTSEPFVTDVLPGRLRGSAAVRGGAVRFFSAFAGARYRVRSSDAADVARAKVVAAFDRVESELGASDYLVGDGFTVADLTAAALLYPVVRPPQGPRLYPLTDSYERFRDELAGRRGFTWVEEMFRRHRVPARDLVAA